jgi:N-acetylglucosaminyl-diphospho-decaprenol L-rhamnosyltransferase
VRLMVNAANRGYTGGNNDGIAAAAGRYVLILNPDTQVIGDALSTLVTYAEAHPDVGVVAPQLLNPDGSVQPSRRRFPTLTTALFESTWLQSMAPRGVLRDYYMLDRSDDETLQVDWAVGACLLVRREVIDQVGPLDEGFFMYSEELDWCRRIKQAGWKIVYLPKAQVIHHMGKSSEQVVAQRHIYFQTSKVRYFCKHHGKGAAGFLRIALLAMYVGQLMLEAAKGLIGHKRELRRERVRAYWQVLRSGLT